MSNLILLEEIGSITSVILNRPERHNSLVPALLSELLAAVEHVQDRSTCRVLMLEASGPSFSTGGDMRGFYEHLDDLEAYADELVTLLNRVILALVDLPLPVLTVVQGIVTGGSMGLVLASDFVLVAPEATFTPYYGPVGFSPDGGWTAMLPAIIGWKRATSILMANRTMTAEEALAWGLADRLVPAATIRQEAISRARELVGMAGGSLRAMRELMHPGQDLKEALEQEKLRFVRQIATPEARSGIVAFMARSQAAGRTTARVD